MSIENVAKKQNRAVVIYIAFMTIFAIAAGIFGGLLFADCAKSDRAAIIADQVTRSVKNDIDANNCRAHNGLPHFDGWDGQIVSCTPLPESNDVTASVMRQNGQCYLSFSIRLTATSTTGDYLKLDDAICQRFGK